LGGKKYISNNFIIIQKNNFIIFFSSLLSSFTSPLVSDWHYPVFCSFISSFNFSISPSAFYGLFQHHRVYSSTLQLFTVCSSTAVIRIFPFNAFDQWTESSREPWTYKLVASRLWWWTTRALKPLHCRGRFHVVEHKIFP
jgi:hypothetical protein